MYNKSFDDVIDLIKDNVLFLSDYQKDLFKRLQDDDGYDVWGCLMHNVNPDPEKFPTFENFLNYVYDKCRNNIYYFLRNIIKLPAQGGGLMDFQLNIGTLAFIEHYVHQHSAYLQNPRQTLQSTTLSCIIEYESMFKVNNATPSIMTRNDMDLKLHLNRSMEISKHIPDNFKNYVSLMVPSKGTKESINSSSKKIVFIDSFEFHEDLTMVLFNAKGDYEGEVLYYVVSTVNPNLTEDEEKYLDDYTFNSIDNFNIFPSLIDELDNDYLVRIWYDSTFFFTDEEHASLKTILGPDCYESEILRIRPSEKI